MSAPTTRPRPDWQTFLLGLLVALVILGLYGSGILYVLQEQQDREGARLHAIVELQTRQIADWLRERQDDAEMIRLSPTLLDEYRRWLDQGDLAAAQQAQARLARLSVKNGIGSVHLYDPDGRPVWGTENMPQHLDPELARALAASATTNRIQRIGPYLDDLGQIHLDHVVPLADEGRSPLVVLHSDAEDWLCPTLRAWPILSDSGETFLFRRDGDQVLYLCPLRHLPNAVLRLRLPVSSERLLAAQWLRGEVGAGDLIKGVDYRGVPVLGVAEAIPGTDWFMIAKLDQAEIRALAVPKILLIGLVGGLMLVIFFAGSLLLRHRQQLALATATHAAQSERLDALERLHASERRFLATFEQAAVGIALVAPDGRWLRINRRFCDLLGYAETELLDKTFQDITHPEDLGRDLDLVGRLLAGEIETYALDKRYIRKDASLAWVHLTVALVRQDDGAPDYFISVIEDISARKAAESRLALWNDAFEKAELNLALGDAIRQRLLAVNPAFAKRRGYRPEDMTDMPVASLFPADRLDETLSQIREADTKGHHVFEAEHLCKDGERFPVLLDVTVTHTEDGRPATRIVYALDISARLAAVAARRESEARLREAQRIAGLGHWEWDARTDRHTWSAEIYQFYGRDPALPPARYPEVAEYFTPESWAGLTQAVETALSEGKAYQCDAEVVRPDGSHRWITARGEPVRDATGQVILLRGTVQDVTARKEAEMDLRTSRQRFQDIVDASADWVWEVDPQGRYTYVSESVVNVLGYTPEELLGRSPLELMPPAEAERVAAVFDDIVARRVSFRDLENINRHRDGSLLHIHTTGMPILNATGELLGYRGLDRDVTDKRQAEIALRDSRELLRTLVRSIPDLVWLKNPQGMFMICNARFEDLLGAPEAQVIGKTDYDFAPRALADTFRANDLDAIAADGPWLNEEELTFASDGHRELVQVIKTPVYDTTGALIGVLGIGRDITRIKRTEDELERHRHHLEELVEERTTELMAARTEAERLARAKSEFLANMSHEIRTPMNAVLGLAYLLERQDLNAEARELARKIHHSGRSLLGIINDILDFSKIESNRIEIERAPLRLDEVLDNLATIMTASAADRSLELVIRPPDCLDCTLLGDALRLGQILINLTGNAIKFTDRGVVEVRIDILQRIESSISLRFAIRDTGIGIDADAQARLFQPFAQADASTTRRFGGSGLGLAISRRLVELMGGRLELDSTPGEGSTFWFDLTFDVLDTGPRRRDDLARIRVLIVDEHAVVREGAAATVAALGWTSTQIASGRQALGHVLRDRSLQGPDAVVLLDWREPGPDVLGIANAIRHTLPASSQPLLFLLAAHNSMALLETPNMRVVDAVLTQPLTPSTFHDAVVRERRRRLGGLPLDQVTMASERRLAGLRLLVVDDSDINREVAQSIFADEGAEIHLARDGREAVDWLCAHPAAVDMVLMDVQMPVMDGRAATRLIRQIPEIAALPIVALTADALRDQEAAALESGMDAFLSKPFDVAEAVTLIRILARRPADVQATDRIRPPGTHHDHRERPAVPVVSAPVPADLIHNERDPARQHPPCDDQGAELPGIDLNQGLKIWKDPNVYRRYLRRFADSYADSVQVMAAAEPDAARQFAHKLKGTAGNLGLPEVAAQAGALEKQFASGLPVSVEPLREALERALDSIARYAPDVIAVVPADARPATSLNLPQVQIASLLREALSAFERFDPAGAAPALEALAAYLPAVQLVPLRQAITEFDVTAGTAAVHDLAGRLAIQMEN